MSNRFGCKLYIRKKWNRMEGNCIWAIFLTGNSIVGTGKRYYGMRLDSNYTWVLFLRNMSTPDFQKWEWEESFPNFKMTANIELISSVIDGRCCSSRILKIQQSDHVGVLILYCNLYWLGLHPQTFWKWSV